MLFCQWNIFDVDGDHLDKRENSLFSAVSVAFWHAVRAESQPDLSALPAVAADPSGQLDYFASVRPAVARLWSRQRHLPTERCARLPLGVGPSAEAMAGPRQARSKTQTVRGSSLPQSPAGNICCPLSEYQTVSELEKHFPNFSKGLALSKDINWIRTLIWLGLWGSIVGATGWLHHERIRATELVDTGSAARAGESQSIAAVVMWRFHQSGDATGTGRS